MAFKSILVSKYVPAEVKRIDTIGATIAALVLTRSKILAPKDKRILVNSGRIKRIAAGVYRIIYGGQRVPYARRRHFENKKNPQTIGYLTNAGESVKKSDVSTQFKGRV